MKLPVEEIREALKAPFSKQQHKRVLLKAPTGSGKSTMVPLMLEEAGEEGMIVVIQPRRIAARMLANRVAYLSESKVGGKVGYVVRFDRKQTDATKIVFVTDGIFQNWCEQNKQLEGISCVIFDEFHERRVAGDVTLAKCLDLQEKSRSDLKIVVMSATLEMKNIAAFLGDCRELEAGGRSYPVEIEYQAVPQATRGFQQNNRDGIWDRCAAAAKKVVESADAGHVLIFLPGVYEIKKTVSLLETMSDFRDYDICPLYSALPPKLQDKAISASEKLKIIVSTNVAETSLTIDGVRTVIDTGLARISEFDSNRGIETLLVKNIAQAAADQRAGRAGRTAPGRCLRLWSQNSHRGRAAFELPEIKRADIAELSLRLSASGYSIRNFRWLDAPDESAIEKATLTLKFLGAFDENEELTEMGDKMAALPLPPRFSRLILAGEEAGCLAEMCFVAAAIQGEGIFTKRRGTVGRSDFIYDEDCCDFVGEWRAFEAAQQFDFQPQRCGQMGILARGARECEMSLRQIHDYVDKLGYQLKRVRFEKRGSEVVAAAVKAFGDRIGKRHSQNSLASKLSDGRRGMIDKDSCAKKADLFIPTEITEVDGKDVVVYFNRCFSVSMELLEEYFSEQLEKSLSVEFDSVSRKVVGKNITLLNGLKIFEEDGGAPDPQLASALLAERVASGDLVLNEWNQGVETWISRLLGLSQWMPELELPDFSEEDRAIALEQICQGAVSYKEIKNKQVLPALKTWLSTPQHAALDAFAPVEVTLKNGRKAKVYYAKDKTPWIALRAQHLFGVEETPTIANGKVKLNVHICAPNNRPWQITDDLPNFWKNGFEQMRKDLGGRYPKHQWTLE